MDCRVIPLSVEDMPKYWYNIQPDLPKPLPPPIDPLTREPVKPEKLEALFAKELVRQEVSLDRWISIPGEVREVYSLWRPTPLIRASRLERYLKTPAKIFYKHEGVSPPGSHKPNTAVAQAYFNMKEGIERLTTETGAGQWGSALAFGCMLFDVKCTIYMVKVSYNQKPYRRTLMRIWGAEVIPSPSNKTDFGRRVLREDPNNPGSLGIAISEAIEDALNSDRTKYSLGSVLNHVLIHQTIVGLEAKEQLKIIDEYPDYVIGCVGGGSNFSGIMWPFYYDVVTGKAEKKVSFIAVEPTACPTLTKGVYTYDHGDAARLTPLLKMHTLGHNFVPPPIHAGGLRYHGDAPTLCLLVKEGIVKPLAYNQVEVFEAATIFTKCEGVLPAPETAHAIKAVIDIALECKRRNEEKVILFNMSGHGYFDMTAYESFLNGGLRAYEYSDEEIKKSISILYSLYPWIRQLNNTA
ncbi:MAG: TrpB-like pyridoxal phosphate-dependent enzyme [Candidatus Nezhaarchaeales archaeon]